MSSPTATAEPASGVETKTRGPLLKSSGPVDDTGQAVAGRNGNGDGRPAAALTLRPAGKSDLVPLAFFFDTLLRKDYFLRRGQLADMLVSPHHRVYVAEIDAILVGIAITTAGTRLVNVLVHPAYRGLGIGRALVGVSEAAEVRVKIDMSSGDPRGFYEALGFRPTGDRGGRGNIEIMRLPRRRATGEPQRRIARAG